MQLSEEFQIIIVNHHENFIGDPIQSRDVETAFYMGREGEK